MMLRSWLFIGINTGESRCEKGCRWRISACNKITDAGVCREHSGSTRILFQEVTNKRRGWISQTHLRSEYDCLTAGIIVYLCVKLCLCRCKSPEAMSQAICWRTKGSGVMLSAARQLWRYPFTSP